ncbi:MAG: SCO family protein [Verrucomicrobia bacterium]|nr:SCO family protein [Cytophagales bacterium]
MKNWIFFSLLFLCACERKLPLMEATGNGIPDFSFVNQDGQTVTQATFEDKIYVADFFFSTCPTVCPVIKKHLLVVQEKFKDNTTVMFLSHTVNPRYDSVPVLKDYAERIGANTKQWIFVTGNPDKLQFMATEGYEVGEKFRKKDTVQHRNMLDHRTDLILVDKNRHIRGIYEGTDKKEVEKLMQDIEFLLREIN